MQVVVLAIGLPVGLIAGFGSSRVDNLLMRGVDMVYAATVDQVYPKGFDTWVDVGPLAGKLEGLHRPGHFRGVATVVS